MSEMNETPEKMSLESMDIAADRMAALRAVVPEAFAETGIDWDTLRRTLGDWVDSSKERFGLNWPGKARCMSVIQQPSAGTLLPMREESVDYDDSRNVIIEGDNLEVLKLLQKSYYGKIKTIYIDPPYNTGNEFIYPDDFKEGLQHYLRFSGQTDEEGVKLNANVESGGRYHSNWLSMMYPRLFLARNLMRNDGVIFISIDDHEVYNLRGLMNEVFGEENFVNEFVWVSNLKGRQIGTSGAASTKEYILCYARSIENVSDFKVSIATAKRLMPSVYKGLTYATQEDDHGPYVVKNELHNTNSEFNEVTRPNLVYDIYFNPESGDVKTETVSNAHVHEGFVKISPKRNNNGVHRYHAFRWGASKVTSESHNLEFVETASGYKVYTKVRDVNFTALKDVFMDISTSAGAKAIEKLGFPQPVFDFPKPVELIQLLCAATSSGDDIVLDFFAGSGTTAHSVIEQNRQDGGDRRFILVQLPERLETGEHASIASITRERVRRVCKQTSDVGFRSYRLSNSNFRAWNGVNDPKKDTDSIQQQLLSLTDNTIEGRTQEDILVELLLKSGFELPTPVQRVELANETAFSVANGALLLSLDEHITIDVIEEMLELNPQMIICLDKGFQGSDELKVNAVQSVQSHNRSTESDIVFRVV